MGICCENGNGVEQDFVKALEWYEKAKEAGDTGASEAIERVKEKDYEKVVEWYEKAVADRNTDAMNHLGVCYYNGHGVPQDYEKAGRTTKKQ